MASGLRLTVRHYYDFGNDRAVVGENLIDPDAWDGLRTKTSGVFAIPTTRDEFARAAEGRRDIAARARAIDAWLEEQGARVVASYGVGGGALEWWLHRLRPGRSLILTDYGEATLARLASVFPEVGVRYHDLRRDEPLPADVHLFHRIDTELGNSEWLEVLRRFDSERVLVVAAEVLHMRRLLFELIHRPLAKWRGASSAGFIRTRAAFEVLWQSTHSAERLRMHELEAWSLVPKRSEAQQHRRADEAAK